ncbi:MAG: chlorophyll synthase ChlG, partial [Pseudomonadota bacterium]
MVASALQPRPHPAAVLELLKPITWFAPMWAFMCGAVSVGVPLHERVLPLVVGIILAGPLVCATSQAINDWYDRFVDAVNEPNRPIPSGRIPGDWGFYIALIGTGISLLVAHFLGPWVLAGAAIGLVLAWAYSAPPVRLKLNGWWGNGAVALSYEGLAWFTGAAATLGALPDWPVLAVLLLYSVGAHGIMTLNDFKAIEGDRAHGVRSLPVQLGPTRAAWTACWVMAVPQVVVIALLLALSTDATVLGAAGGIAVLLAVQVRLMATFLA